MHPEKLIFILNTLGLIASMLLLLCLWGGLACFEAGLIRRRGVVTIWTQKWVGAAVSIIGFILIGQHFFAAQKSMGGFPFPTSFEWSPVLMAGMKERTFAYPLEYLLHGLLAVLASSLLTGALAERLRTWPYVFFCAIFSTFIYPICGFWAWQEGFLSHLGFSDYSGAGSIFLVGAAASVGGVLHLRARRSDLKSDKVLLASNIPMAAMGGFGIWIGFFGLYAASNLSFSSPNDAIQLTVMFEGFLIAAAVGLLMGLMISRFWFGKNDLTLALNGMIAALTALSAGPIFNSIWVPILIAVAASFLAILGIFLTNRLVDDPNGTISTFGVSSILGLILVPFWQGEAKFWVQLLGILSLGGFSFIVSFIYFYMVDTIFGIQDTEEELKIYGIDLLDCGFEAYPEFLEKN